MPSLQATDIQDVVNSTLNELGRAKITDIMSDYRDTIFFKRLMRRNKVTVDGGTEIEFTLLTDHNDSARFWGIGETDIVDIPNVTTRGKVGWRHITWNWAMDGRLIAMNSGSAHKIFDLVKEQRLAAMASAIIKFEKRGWRCPASTDNVNPYGIPYWIVKNNTAGFNGGTPIVGGFSVVGNVNPTTTARWKNYTDQYTLVTKDDLIRKLRKAMYKTKIKALVDGTPEYNTGDDVALYTNYSVLATIEEILESQNDNLGADIASMDGKAVMRKVPIVAVDELDNDSTNPVYGVNWGEFKTVVLKGYWMKETVEAKVAGQHNVAATFTDCAFNWICRNRRRQFVVATNTTDIAA